MLATCYLVSPVIVFSVLATISSYIGLFHEVSEYTNSWSKITKHAHFCSAIPFHIKLFLLDLSSSKSEVSGATFDYSVNLSTRPTDDDSFLT